MDFPKLEAAILNNSKEQPTIYMAFCMMESILQDFSDQTKTALFDNPIGDDRLPIKMTMLCRQLNAVYEKKGAELEKGRQNLNRQMEMLLSQQKDLGEEESGLRDRITDLQDSIKVLKQDKNDLEQQQKKLEGEKKKTEKALEETQGDIGRLKDNIARLNDSLTDLGTTMDKLTIENGDLSGKVQEKKEVVKDFEENSVVPLRRELESAESRLKDLERERDSLNQQNDEFEKTKRDCMGEIAILRGKVKETQAKAADKQKELENMRSRKKDQSDALKSTKKKLDDIFEEIGRIQDEIIRLEQEQIPSAEAALKKEKEHKGEWQDKLDSIINESNYVQSEATRLIESIKRNGVHLEQLRNNLNTLAVDDQAKTEEIGRLQQQLEELRGKSDREKYIERTRQLQGECEELQRICTENQRLQNDISAKETELETETAHFQKLRHRQAELQSAIRDTKALAETLKQFASDGYISRIEQEKARLEQMERIRTSLLDSMNKMDEALGKTPFARNEISAVRLREEIRSLQERADQLRGSIIECVNSLELEEKT